ncbi:MAG: sigma-54 factor interaction domain-containing protein [Candidatus Latescibacterota bacterium]
MNCGAIPEQLVGSELFGHEKGAFTGVVARQLGKAELAGGGTLFLDEIGDLSPEAQGKLLRLLEEGTFERVGGRQTLRLRARVVAATNRDLRGMVAAGAFREDLYYRLHVFTVEALRCASAARTSRSWPRTSQSAWRSTSTSGSTASRRPPWSGCRRTPGRATSASCSTPWSAR